jgi:hypothetical protein
MLTVRLASCASITQAICLPWFIPADCLKLLDLSYLVLFDPSFFILHSSFSPTMQTTIRNIRAKLPIDLAALSNQFNVSYRDILSTNPKTEKSKIQTYILHLAPHNISGVNVCAGAGNCAKICLHFAGNPVYMKNKQSARIRRTLAFSAKPSLFVRLVICAILDKINKNSGEPIALRLNGTSDIPWENIDVDILPEFVTFCRVKFGQDLPIGKRNIFEIFNYIRDHGGPSVVFYDYTKIKRNWAECKRIGYHLTFSFDGWDNAANLKIAASALSAGVNVAAAFNVKKSQDLPRFAYLGNRKLNVVDGDLTDYRPSDPDGYNIVGLRFKLPHGLAYSDAERQAFCIA